MSQWNGNFPKKVLAESTYILDQIPAAVKMGKEWVTKYETITNKSNNTDLTYKQYCVLSFMSKAVRQNCKQ